MTHIRQTDMKSINTMEKSVMTDTQHPVDDAALHTTDTPETGLDEQTEPQGELVGELAQLQSRLESIGNEHKEQLLRMQAELENSRRRAAQDVEKAHKFALEKFVTELLPVKDSLELGLAASTGTDDAVAKLREGMELTLKMLASCLEKFGVQEVDPYGKPFNPEQHQAMSMQESAQHEANTVMMVMQKGYLLNERLIRPAMVVVSKAPANPPPDAPSIDEQA